MKELIAAADEELMRQINNLSAMEDGTKEKKEAISDLVKLNDSVRELKSVALEEQKIKNEKEQKVLDRQIEAEKNESEKKDRKAKNWLTALGIGLPCVGAVWATIISWKKEEENSMTYTAGKNSQSSLLSFFKR